LFAAGPAGLAEEDLDAELALADLEQRPTADVDGALSAQNAQRAPLEEDLAAGQLKALAPLELALLGEEERPARELDASPAALAAEDCALRELARLEGLEAPLARCANEEPLSARHAQRCVLGRRWLRGLGRLGADWGLGLAGRVLRLRG
tara:strand:+ start:985 stop:1434 length:450 start_codon:yes stop_codon:yes gene_type:complete